MKQYLATITLIALTLAGTAYYLNNDPIIQSKESEYLFERHFYKQNLQNSNKLKAYVPPIQSYKITHTLEVNQSPHDLESKIQARHIIIEAECDIQQIDNYRTDTVEFAVSYSKMVKKGDEFDIHTNSNLKLGEDDSDFIYENVSNNDKREIYEGEKKDGDLEVKILQDRFFLVSAIDYSGEITSIQGEVDVEEDEHITWMTQMLINDMMPETRRSNYNKRILEKDSLGKVNALYRSNSVNGKLHISKLWTEQDFQRKSNIQLPDMSYQRDIYLTPSTGIVENGESVFNFNVGRQGLMALESGMEIENAGQLYGSIRQKFHRYINSGENLNNLAKEILRYRRNAQFKELPLSFDKKGSFGHIVIVKKQSTYVNRHRIAQLMDLRWKNCANVNSDHMHERKFTLFKAVFPLLGIINIPVSASTKFHYGYKRQLTGGPGSCTFTLGPHFEAELYADGRVSALGIIDAGIYSAGKFMDVDLTFTSSQNRNNLSSSLTGNFKAFSLDIGATYTRYNCSPKRWLKSEFEQEELDLSRRQLRHIHIGRHIKKLFHRVHKVVRKAEHVVKKVAKVVRNGVNGIIGAFCQRRQGYKQIIHKHQNPYTKTLFSKSYNI